MAILLIIIITIIKPLSQNIPEALGFSTRPLTRQRCEEQVDFGQEKIWFRDKASHHPLMNFDTQLDGATNLM